MLARLLTLQHICCIYIYVAIYIYIYIHIYFYLSAANPLAGCSEHGHPTLGRASEGKLFWEKSTSSCARRKHLEEGTRPLRKWPFYEDPSVFILPQISPSQGQLGSLVRTKPALRKTGHFLSKAESLGVGAFSSLPKHTDAMSLRQLAARSGCYSRKTLHCTLSNTLLPARLQKLVVVNFLVCGEALRVNLASIDFAEVSGTLKTQRPILSGKFRSICRKIPEPLVGWFTEEAFRNNSGPPELFAIVCDPFAIAGGPLSILRDGTCSTRRGRKAIHSVRKMLPIYFQMLSEW